MKIPTANVPFTEIDGIPCYAPEAALSYADYPSEGFDVTAAVEARSFWCRSRIRLIRRIIAQYTESGRTLDMLDVGCGIGGMVGGLQSLGRLNLTGSEIYLSGLKYARSRLPDASFIQLDATRIPFTAAFDIIGAFDVLEHIDEDETVMASVRDALRPGGLFLITVPQYPWMWSHLDDIVHHKRRYTRGELKRKLRAAGFDVLRTTSFVSLLFPPMVLSRLLSRTRDRTSDTTKEFESEVNLPGPLNTAFDVLMRVDEALIALGLSLPAGGSLLAVARRPRN
jgi:SAM-dependent methyltransferase